MTIVADSKERLNKLKDDILEALKLWYDVNTNISPLGYLQIFRQQQLNGAINFHQATNQLLLDALDELHSSHPVNAKILRGRFLDGDTVYTIANQLNLSEPSIYRKQKSGLTELAKIIQAKENYIKDNYKTILERRLEPATYTRLIGAESHIQSLVTLLTDPNPPWLVVIKGIGGIGKTSMADALARRAIDKKLFEDFAWVSARQHYFQLQGGIKPRTDQPVLTSDDLIEQLTQQLMPEVAKSSTRSTREIFELLKTRLKQYPHLIIIDNLETVVDLDTLMPTLRSLVDPSKILLTSRQSLHYEAGLHHFSLPELDEAGAIELIHYEAKMHNLPAFKQVTHEKLREVVGVVGGNPLALRLVVGQAHVYELNVILNDLKTAQGQSVEDFYTFIYRQAWHDMSETTREIFLVMPLVVEAKGTLDYLVEMSEQSVGAVRGALDTLVSLNLVDTNGSLDQRRYSIHNLTRSFLQEQVLKWR